MIVTVLTDLYTITVVPVLYFWCALNTSIHKILRTDYASYNILGAPGFSNFTQHSVYNVWYICFGTAIAGMVCSNAMEYDKACSMHLVQHL